MLVPLPGHNLSYQKLVFPETKFCGSKREYNTVDILHDSVKLKMSSERTFLGARNMTDDTVLVKHRLQLKPRMSVAMHCLLDMVEILRFLIPGFVNTTSIAHAVPENSQEEAGHLCCCGVQWMSCVGAPLANK